MHQYRQMLASVTEQLNRHTICTRNGNCQFVSDLEYKVTISAIVTEQLVQNCVLQ